ncbi:hypothetical protein NEF87_002671 [Candidatus Lokiarchaeum ossiferum]|uniref:Uncharacterized protein n=1 Tax=Candidatus Lokiarchaeum ossiferum TaxID=2951803 RepID=A0ABY6HSI7_9ARCH|nr:hypothetical protein NEF87_002671 [Candidatus Lokiarchaeum sp. B-35]
MIGLTPLFCYGLQEIDRKFNYVGHPYLPSIGFKTKSIQNFKI